MIGRRCTGSNVLSRPVLIARDLSKCLIFLVLVLSQDIYCGGYSGGEPPLPIPNREVKPAIADGTAPPGGRVGSCRSSGSPMRDHRTSFFLSWRVLVLSFFYPSGCFALSGLGPFLVGGDAGGISQMTVLLLGPCHPRHRKRGDHEAKRNGGVERKRDGQRRSTVI